MSDPVVVFGSMEHPGDYGDSVANGGYKLQSLWIKLLAQHGVEAYRVTRDGTLTNWLIEPPPAVAYETVKHWIATGRDVKVVTTWMAADAMLDLVPRPYWYDAELAHSACGYHFENLRRRLPSLAKIGTHSRHIAAWYLAIFGITPVYIKEWSETTHWKDDPAKRIMGRVGYMNEGPHTDAHIDAIKQLCQQAGLMLQFTQIQGNEAEVITQMQACDVFLGMNPGKHELYAEGCPRSQHESMHCGCIVVAYDVLGNREYVFDGYTGWLVKRGDPVDMARALIEVMTDPNREAMRARSLDFIRFNFAPSEIKWRQVKDFLDL